MQMIYCFINNVHVVYVELLREGLHYSLMHPANLIPYPIFTKIIIDYYTTEHPDITRRFHDNYHRVKNDNLVKNILNFGKNKDGAGMKIPDWMITSTPRTPKPEVVEGESSAQRKSIVIRLCNVAKVNEHLEDEKLNHMLKGADDVDIDVFMDDVLNNKEDPDTRIEPESYKESPEAEKDVDMVTTHDEVVEEESAGDEFELKKRENGKDAPLLVDKEKLKELTDTDPSPSSSIPSSSLPKPKT
nr:hypothetical protein [Tanacetum cinerariifolium]